MLTRQATPPFGETTWLQWRMSFSTKLYYWTFVGMFIFLLFVDIKVIFFDKRVLIRGALELYLAWALLALPLWFIIHLDRGYRIAFDDEAIYTRQHGVRWNLQRYPFIRIPFDEIALVRGEWDRMRPYKGKLIPAKYVMPFQFVRVYRADWDGRELFPLVGGELRDDEFKDLLQLVDAKAPGTLSEEVRQYMENDYRF